MSQGKLGQDEPGQAGAGWGRMSQGRMSQGKLGQDEPGQAGAGCGRMSQGRLGQDKPRHAGAG